MAKAPADVVISWYSTNASTQAARASFQRPTRFLDMPAGSGTTNPRAYIDQIGAKWPLFIQTTLREKMPDVQPLRVALMGFSEGCQGVREALKCGDGPRVDAVIACDGIHSQWIDQKKGTFDSAYLLAWRAMALAAVADGRMLCITTSAVVPPMVSTTITSDWIWQQAAGSDEGDDQGAMPPVFSGPVDPPYVSPAGSFGAGQQSWQQTTYTTWPIRRYRKKNGLYVLNFDDLDPTGVGDHRFQGERVLPLVMTLNLAERWNRMEPVEGSGAILMPTTQAKPIYFDMKPMGPAQVVAGNDSKTGDTPEGTTDEKPAPTGMSTAGKVFTGIVLGVVAGVAAVVATRDSGASRPPPPPPPPEQDDLDDEIV